MGGAGSSCSSQGELHNSLQKHYPSKEWGELVNSDGLTLTNIYYCQKSDHDFLIIELLKDNQHYYNIRAEKFGKPNPGTYISWLNDQEDVKARENSKVTTLKCGGKPVKLQWVVNILESLSPLYNYVCHNCWQFASDAARKLVSNIPNLPTTDKQKLLSQIP